MQNRIPLLIVAVVVIVFFAIGGYLIFGHQQRPTQARSFNVVVTGTSANPDHLLAYQGDTVTITVQTDRKEEIHLHGYDIHFFADKGKPVTHKFTADKTGNYDMEIEQLGQQVVTFEVDPR